MAETLLDVDRVYTPYVNDTYPTPHDVWKSQVQFRNRLANDKKFTNEFHYERYDIIEYQKGEQQIVEFVSKESSAAVQTIHYTLELADTWKVVEIEWIK